MEVNRDSSLQRGSAGLRPSATPDVTPFISTRQGLRQRSAHSAALRHGFRGSPTGRPPGLIHEHDAMHLPKAADAATADEPPIGTGCKAARRLRKSFLGSCQKTETHRW